MSNERDQAIVTSAISDTGSGLLEFLPALGQREAIAFGDGVALPVRIKFDELPKYCLPRSSTAQLHREVAAFDRRREPARQVVEKWRSSGTAGGDGGNLAAFAEAMGIHGQEAEHAPAPAPVRASWRIAAPATGAGAAPGRQSPGCRQFSPITKRLRPPLPAPRAASMPCSGASRRLSPCRPSLPPLPSPPHARARRCGGLAIAVQPAPQPAAPPSRPLPRLAAHSARCANA